MGQKGHIIVQKGLKMHKKRQKLSFWTQKNFTDNQCAQKSLAESTPPLTEKIR